MPEPATIKVVFAVHRDWIHTWSQNSLGETKLYFDLHVEICICILKTSGDAVVRGEEECSLFHQDDYYFIIIFNVAFLLSKVGSG